MLKRIALAALLATLPSGAWAANCSSNPFTLQNGQTADATQVMANFNNLLNCANNNLAHNGANSDITSLSGLTTPLSVVEGGTGSATLTLNNVLLGNGISPVQFVAPSTSGNVLTSNGTTWVSALTGIQSVLEGTQGGINIVSTSSSVTLNFKPSDLPVKTTPTSADSIVIADVAAASTGKVSLISALTTVINSGTPIKIVNVETTGVLTGTTLIPNDDTIPQITEGTEFMTLAITPTNTASTLLIDVIFLGAVSSPVQQIVALFQDATANSLATVACSTNSTTLMATCPMRHKMTAGTTVSTTFRVRAGPDGAATLTFNGFGSARRFGGVAASSMTITEIAP